MIEQNWRGSNPTHDHHHEATNNNERKIRTRNHNVNCQSLSNHSNSMPESNYSTNSTTCSQIRGHGSPVKLMAADENSVVSDLSTTQEFLPLCDALFNVISLGAYFCDIVFDVLTAYTFLHSGFLEWGILSTCLIALSLILSQVLSLRWYKGQEKRGQEPPSRLLVLIPVHLTLTGVLWRYFKLFIPVDLRFIKSEVRDLCLLRLVHGFCEAGPMLLLQMYVICTKPSAGDVSDLDIVSTALSLFNICWALASYSKNIRRQNVHKLVLTWLGVIFQFLWRLGTITSRVVALTVWATTYGYWLFLVLFMHWLSMWLWLISPKNTFDGEKMRSSKKIGYSAVIAVVYTFCYINVSETTTTASRPKVIIFYVTMFLENSLLISVWLVAGRGGLDPWFKDLAISLVFGAFVGGIGFMCLYYRAFHIRKLSYANPTASSRSPSNRGSSLVTTVENGYSGKGGDGVGLGHPKHLSLTMGITPPTHQVVQKPCATATTALYNRINSHHMHHHQNVMPGVFNCRFNPAIKRKKKKPSSFVPPGNPRPEISSPDSRAATTELGQPFWKRPMVTPVTLGSENEGRVNIAQKLHEKKQKQLADLMEIEEEIKQGKFRRPYLGEIPEPTTGCKFRIPTEKKQPWFVGGMDPPTHTQRSPIIIPPTDPDPNELLLDPHYLMYSPSGFYERPEWNVNFYDEPLYQNDKDGGFDDRSGNGSFIRRLDGERKSYRLTSDVESQLSIPRSYTLPREFKYKRKARKAVKNEHFPSTNSSDGDVDSAEDDRESENHLAPFPLPNPTVHSVAANQGRRGPGSRKQKQARLHETKL